MGKLLLALFAAGKLGKVLFSGGSMLLSMLAYSFTLGWKYAVGFVGLIFCHEMGHYMAARSKGLEVGLPTFIPFVGAWIELKNQPCHVETEAYVAFAGPIAGTAAAMACYWLGRETGSSLFLALAYSGLMLNLFNLIPIAPLDGGRITAIISPKLWLLGVPLLMALFFYRPSPMLLLVGVLALPQLARALKKDNGASTLPTGYYNVDSHARINYAVLYLGLAAFLAVMAYELHQGLNYR